MKTQQANLKVSFYLKKNHIRNGLCQVMGRITIDKSSEEDMVEIPKRISPPETVYQYQISCRGCSGQAA